MALLVLVVSLLGVPRSDNEQRQEKKIVVTSSSIEATVLVFIVSEKKVFSLFLSFLPFPKGRSSKKPVVYLRR